MVSHLRDVGLIGTSYYDNDTHITTGKKVVYIAPMKALVCTRTSSYQVFRHVRLTYNVFPLIFLLTMKGTRSGGKV